MSDQLVKIIAGLSLKGLQDDVNNFISGQRNYVGRVHDVRLTAADVPVRGGNRPESELTYIATILYTRKRVY